MSQREASLLYEPDELEGDDADADEADADDEDAAEVGASKVARPRYPLPTIPRPLSSANREHIATVRWGDRVELTFPPGSVSSPGSAQFSAVELPRPMVCTVSFHCEIMAPILGTVSVTVLDLIFGVGSASYSRRFAFSTLPALNSPIDFVLDAIPLRRLQGQISGVGFGGQKIFGVISVAPVSGAE